MLLTAATFALPACAAIFFSMTYTGNKLTVTNLGSESAYHPRALRLNANGVWETLPASVGTTLPTELAGNAHFELQWTIPTQSNDPFSSSQPMMIRYFDQAGSSFGQLSFFNQPAVFAESIPAKYVDGLLIIRNTDKKVRSSWLLWAQEEGVSPLTTPVRFEHEQPNARYLDWQSSQEARMNLGHGQPSAMLLHDTDLGWQLQIVDSGGLRGQEQRTGWLKASARLYHLATGAAVAALMALITLLLCVKQKRTAP